VIAIEKIGIVACSGEEYLATSRAQQLACRVDGIGDGPLKDCELQLRQRPRVSVDAVDDGEVMIEDSASKTGGEFVEPVGDDAITSPTGRTDTSGEFSGEPPLGAR